jgi:hypothetical protein
MDPDAGSTSSPRYGFSNAMNRDLLARALLVALPLAVAAPAAASCPPVELVYDANEQIAEKKADTNKDCRHDQHVFYVDGVAQRAERDTDFDGRLDVWVFYEKDARTSTATARRTAG